jgi:tRNA threonylcarbamoyladenosine biosynthesis protein TsaE
LITIMSDSPEKTISIGKTLGSILKPGSVICLRGDLGAGKTHFAKGVALGLGIEEHVTSPTYTIIKEYEGRMPFYHVDAYRLDDEDEAYELGLEEYLYGKGVTLIEWPERLQSVLPNDCLNINIKQNYDDNEEREFVLKPVGSEYIKIVEELKEFVCAGD